MENAEPKFKCSYCLLFLKQSDLNGDKCPECGKVADKMCPNDHACTCIDEITGGTQTCKICGAFTCPCGSEDCYPVSRVTGYLANVNSWSSGKRAEFVDRTRYEGVDKGNVN